MRLTYDEALHHWTLSLGPRPIRTGPGRYDYCYEGSLRA